MIKIRSQGLGGGGEDMTPSKESQQNVVVKHSLKSQLGNQSVIVRQNANSHIENVAENLETEEVIFFTFFNVKNLKLHF